MTQKARPAAATDTSAPEKTTPDGGSAAQDSLPRMRPRSEGDPLSAGPPSGDFIDLNDIRLVKPTNNAEFVAVIGMRIQFGTKDGGGICSRIYFRPGDGCVYLDLTEPGSNKYRGTSVVFVGSGEFGSLKRPPVVLAAE